MCVATPNDPKLSDGGVRRGTCMVGGKAAAEAGAVTHGAVRRSAWLGAWEYWIRLRFIGAAYLLDCLCDVFAAVLK